ncbi:MAG: hypothetical protein ABI808_11195 [Pseudonocardiales bacterium]
MTTPSSHTMSGAVAAELSIALGRAHEAINIARHYNLDIPDEYTAAETLLEAARAAMAAPEPLLPPVPTKAADVPKWIRSAATAHAAWVRDKEFAAVLNFDAQRAVLRAAQHIPATCTPKLVELFAAEAQTFLDLIGQAPRTLTGWETPEQLDNHAVLIRTAANMTRLFGSRGIMSTASGEATDLGPDHAVFTVIAPDPDDQAAREVIDLIRKKGAIATVED